jgi:hypothetical protein
MVLTKIDESMIAGQFMVENRSFTGHLPKKTYQ